MLSSAVQVVAQGGFERMSVARVTAGARVSRRTFYDLFEDREDCFLAAFEDVLARLGEVVVPAFERGGRRWRERVRAGLVAFLEFLDEEPALGVLLVVDSVKVGPRVLARRVEVIARVEAIVDEGRSESRWSPSPLTAEGVVGAVLGVIATRMQEARREGSLLELCNALMAMIVLPYLGHAAAQKELRGSRTFSSGRREASSGLKSPTRLADSRMSDPFEGLAMRLTYRTLRTLQAIAEQPGASNREVGDAADVPDQGQMSKLLARLEGLGLLQNTGGGHPNGEPNAWRLTKRGEEVQDAIQIPSRADAQPNRRETPR
jgi:AcrR family transcriptional regulator/DNA-binding MarR family transcriptional regulator